MNAGFHYRWCKFHRWYRQCSLSISTWISRHVHEKWKIRRHSCYNCPSSGCFFLMFRTVTDNRRRIDGVTTDALSDVQDSCRNKKPRKCQFFAYLSWYANWKVGTGKLHWLLWNFHNRNVRLIWTAKMISVHLINNLSTELFT